MWSCEKNPCQFTYPKNCYRFFFPIIVFVGFGVQYVLASIHQEDLPSKAPSRRFASKAPSRRFASKAPSRRFAV